MFVAFQRAPAAPPFIHPSLSSLTLFAGLCFCVGEYGRLKIDRHKPGQVGIATPTNSCMNTERTDADLSQHGRNSATACTGRMRGYKQSDEWHSRHCEKSSLQRSTLRNHTVSNTSKGFFAMHIEHIESDIVSTRETPVRR